MRTPQTTKLHGRNETTVSSTVVETIADAKGVTPMELEPRLYDVIEPEALDELFKCQEDDPVTEGFISFTFHEYEVTVHSDSSIEIEQIRC